MEAYVYLFKKKEEKKPPRLGDNVVNHDTAVNFTLFVSYAPR